MMQGGSMGDGMGWMMGSMGLVGLLGIVVLVLAGVALFKFVRQ